MRDELARVVRRLLSLLSAKGENDGSGSGGNGSDEFRRGKRLCTMIDAMTEPLRLHATLEPRGPAGAIVLDDEQVAGLGGGARTFPVRVTVGDQLVALRLTRMGGENLIGLRREIRMQLGVELGDDIEVLIERDDAPREIAMPPELEDALESDPAARVAFDALAPSHRREHARSVADAKRPETRSRRVQRVLAALSGG